MNREYIKPQSNVRQFNAIMNYAGKHTYSHAALIICAVKGKKPPSWEVVEENILEKGAKMGALPTVVVILD